MSLCIQGANFYSKLLEIISADLLTCRMLTMYVIKSMFTVFGMIELLRNLICFEKKNLQRKPIISKKKKKASLIRIFDKEYNIYFGFINIHIVGNPQSVLLLLHCTQEVREVRPTVQGFLGCNIFMEYQFSIEYKY